LNIRDKAVKNSRDNFVKIREITRNPKSKVQNAK